MTSAMAEMFIMDRRISGTSQYVEMVPGATIASGDHWDNPVRSSRSELQRFSISIRGVSRGLASSRG